MIVEAEKLSPKEFISWSRHRDPMSWSGNGMLELNFITQ
ncbi:hypothetical protein GXM_08098 [Nostoc sphaeroides CCNUC1]|uniref:Uncharacterized protein n=1 Tax=Nostoc sphaeroides CCNUC1 TaxID=2653204 RepID=A0A5P8WD89_9NOSO|nr:hypothetical protein GXM_08098 [Nostoc sphaeroides CCNUC1]